MSFDFPANIERDIHLFAQSEHISPSEAAIKLVADALKAKKRKAAKNDLSQDEMDRLRNSPTAKFFGSLSAHAIDEMERASKEIRTERFVPRGLIPHRQ